MSFDPPSGPPPRRPRPALSVQPVTGTLIALNVAVFVFMAGFLKAGWFETTSLDPYIRFGANNGAATTDGQWWRLLTSMFMHFGILHLAFNMWALLQAGSLVERLQGRALYALTYLASGIGGGLLSIDWHGDKTWGAGASGAIFGVYGALLGYIARDRLVFPRAVLVPLTKSTVLFAGYNLVYGFVNPAIDNAAHIGGLATGLALGWLTAPSPTADRTLPATGRRLTLAAAAAAVIIAAGVALAPRFDYSVRDELAWKDALQGLDERQEDLEQSGTSEIGRWLNDRSNAQVLLRSIQSQLIPFYEELGQRVGALKLAPGKVTARRQAVFAEYASQQVEAYRHLALAVQANDMGEFKAFSDLRQKAERTLGSLPAPPVRKS
jgi:rhomboid protease GluP